MGCPKKQIKICNKKKSTMGHDIDIVIPKKKKDGELVAKDYVSSVYISYNWRKYKPYFHISDVNGYNGSFVKKKILEALDKMKNDGYDESHKPCVDGWGQALDRSVKDSWNREEYEKDRLCMFGSILKHFLEKAREHPRGHWFSDCIDEREFRFPDGEEFEEHGSTLHEVVTFKQLGSK